MDHSPHHGTEKPTFIKPILDGPSARLEASLSLAIHEHRLLPGMKLREDELCEIYGVSRTAVRTALQSLYHSQLVEIKRNRGAFVAKPSAREALEVFEARSLLEPHIAFEAAKRITDEDIQHLESHMLEEHAAIAAREHGRALRLSGQFHIDIARIADQSTIQGMIEKLVSRSSLIIAVYWGRKSALCEKHAHHALLKAFKLRDGHDAKELMQSHLVDILAALDLKKDTDAEYNLRDILKG